MKQSWGHVQASEDRHRPKMPGRGARTPLEQRVHKPPAGKAASSDCIVLREDIVYLDLEDRAKHLPRIAISEILVSRGCIP